MKSELQFPIKYATILLRRPVWLFMHRNYSLPGHESFSPVPGIKFAGSCGRRGEGRETTEILIVTYLCLIFVDTSLIFSILLSLKPQSPQGKFYLWLLFVHSLGLNALVSKELWACGCVWGLCAEELEFIMGWKTTEGNFHLAKLHPVTCTTIIRFSLESLWRNWSEMETACGIAYSWCHVGSWCNFLLTNDGRWEQNYGQQESWYFSWFDQKKRQKCILVEHSKFSVFCFFFLNC